MARRSRRRNKPDKGSRFTTETGMYKGEVKTGEYAVIRNKNSPSNNLIFTDKDKLGALIQMLKKLKNKL